MPHGSQLARRKGGKTLESEFFEAMGSELVWEWPKEVARTTKFGI
jgi:hypothetical protein